MNWNYPETLSALSYLFKTKRITKLSKTKTGRHKDFSNRVCHECESNTTLMRSRNKTTTNKTKYAGWHHLPFDKQNWYCNSCYQRLLKTYQKLEKIKNGQITISQPSSFCKGKCTRWLFTLTVDDIWPMSKRNIINVKDNRDIKTCSNCNVAFPSNTLIANEDNKCPCCGRTVKIIKRKEDTTEIKDTISNSTYPLSTITNFGCTNHCKQLIKEKRIYHNRGNPSRFCDNINDWYQCRRCCTFMPLHETIKLETDIKQTPRCPCCHYMVKKGVKQKTRRYEHTLKRID